MLYFQEMAIHQYQEEMAQRYLKHRMKNQNHMNPSHIVWCQIGEILELTLLPENRLVHLHTWYWHQHRLERFTDYRDQKNPFRFR